MLTRARVTALIGLAVLAAGTIAGCGIGMGDPVQPYFGWAVVGDAPTVFVPVCSDNPIDAVDLYDEPDIHAGTTGTIVWHVTSPTTDDAKNGFITLGKDAQFAVVGKPLPGNVPRHVTVAVVTHDGHRYSDTINDVLATRSYPRGTHLEDISFTVQSGPQKTIEMTSTQLRASFIKRVGHC